MNVIERCAMHCLLLVLVLVLAACSSAGYEWNIPPGGEARFKLDNYECDRTATGAYPTAHSTTQEGMKGDLQALQEALYKRCMQEKGYQTAE